MNKRDLIKHHLTQLSIQDLLRYRLLFCSGTANEDIELDITDLFKYPGRLQTSYLDNWQRDVLKALFINIKPGPDTPAHIESCITTLLGGRSLSDKDQRTLALFDDFLATQKASNVELIHRSLHNRLNKLSF